MQQGRRTGSSGSTPKSHFLCLKPVCDLASMLPDQAACVLPDQAADTARAKERKEREEREREKEREARRKVGSNATRRRGRPCLGRCCCGGHCMAGSWP